MIFSVDHSGIFVPNGAHGTCRHHPPCNAPALKIREEGDGIIVEPTAESGVFSPISNGNDTQPTSGKIPIPRVGNLGGQDETAPDVAAGIDRAIKRNPRQGRETVAEKIRRERDALGWLAAQEPEIAIPFHAISDIAETNEHNIGIADDGRFWKYTKGDQYGYAPAETYPDLHDFSNLALGIDPASPSNTWRGSGCTTAFSAMM